MIRLEDVLVCCSMMYATNPCLLLSHWYREDPRQLFLLLWTIRQLLFHDLSSLTIKKYFKKYCLKFSFILSSDGKIWWIVFLWNLVITTFVIYTKSQKFTFKILTDRDMLYYVSLYPFITVYSSQICKWPNTTFCLLK